MTNVARAASTGQSIELIELGRTRSEVSRFLRSPYAIYPGDPNWVAPLLADLKTVFSDKNPLFQHAEMRLWIAMRDGRDIGRIAGVIDRNHNEFHNESSGFFGFFEAENDPAVAAALLDAVSTWAKSKGMMRLLGPMNPTTNDECGLLVEGFDSPPVFMMTYNPRYYVDLIEGAGFVKAKDLLAYHFHVGDKPLARLTRVAEGVRRREPGLVLRKIRRKTLAKDLTAVKEVYNAAWEKNWGFVPMTDAELDFMAARLKPVLVEDWALVAEIDGEPVGFMLSLPDFNEAIRPLRGRLLTPRIFGFLRYLMGWRKPKFARVVTLGLKQEFRQRGLDAVMFAQSLKYALSVNVRETEVSWVLEDNTMTLRAAEIFGGSRYKTYRIYERAL